MRKPFLQDDAFLEEVEAHRSSGDGLRLWWLGQSGYLMQSRGTRVILDPYLSDSLTRKYATTDKPHVRMVERVVDPSRLDGALLVTSSHNHTDHLDAETLLPLMQASPDCTVVVPEANLDFAAARLNVETLRLTCLDAGETLELSSGVRVTAVPAAHEKLDLDAAGRHPYLGYVLEMGGHRIYHSGDTVLYEGMEEDLEHWGVDLAILPVNGRAPERRVSGNLWGDEAARLARAISAQCVIPCHYDLFEFNTATTELFERTCREIGQPFQVLQVGEGWTLPPVGQKQQD